MKLVEYTQIDEMSYLEYIKEWEMAKEKIVPWATTRNNQDFAAKFESWKDEQSDLMYEKGFVPATLFFMIDDKKKIIGAIHFRHELNDNLLRDGGHIGYGIRPSERKKGNATIMLNMLLKQLIDKGYEKVLVTCDDDNAGSYSTIEKHGGIPEDKRQVGNEYIRRYWIDLENNCL